MGGPSAPPPTDIDFVADSGSTTWTKNTKNLGSWEFSAVQPTRASYTFPDGSSGYVYEFNGSTTWATSPVLSDTNAWADDQISVSIWFYPTQFGVQLLTETDVPPVNNDNTSYHATVLEIDSSGYVKARFYNGASAISSTQVILNQWNHIYFGEAWTGDHYFQVNGLETAVSRPSYNRLKPADLGGLPERFCIGAYSVTNQGNTNRFQGKLGDITISDYIAPSTFATYREKYRPAPLAIRLDAGNTNSYDNINSPTIWLDTVANNGFILYNSPAYSSDQGGKLTFSPGSSQYAETPSSLPSASRWTVETWHYYDGTNSGGSPCIVTEIYPNPGAINYTLGVNDDTNNNLKAAFFNGSAWAGTANSITLTAGNWYHIVGTYDGTTLKLYINGSLASQTNYSGTQPSSGSAGIRLMNRWDLGQFWGGALSIVRIYTGALTEGNIQANFNTEKARFGLQQR